MLYKGACTKNDKIKNKKHQTFENIRRIDENEVKFWPARDLYPILEYSSWDKFKAVIKKAIKACENSKINVSDHFSQVGKMVTIGSGAKRNIEDYDDHLSRYACYLVIQNADPSKEIVASGQTYFAIQTRRQELKDNQDFQQLDENKNYLDGMKNFFLRFFYFLIFFIKNNAIYPLILLKSQK